MAGNLKRSNSIPTGQNVCKVKINSGAGVNFKKKGNWKTDWAPSNLKTLDWLSDATRNWPKYYNMKVGCC